MTNEEAIKQLKKCKSFHNGSYGTALDMAIKALEQTERIAKLVNELDLADILPKDYDNIFYLQSVKEVKEEMWRMYRFAEDVSYTLMAESEDKE